MRLDLPLAVSSLPWRPRNSLVAGDLDRMDDSEPRPSKCRCGGSLSSTCTTVSSFSFSVDETSLSHSLSNSPLKSKVAREEFSNWETLSRRSTRLSLASDYSPSPKSSNELRREIASLEADILSLERHLLLLYRTAFQGRGSSFSSATSNCILDKDGFGLASPVAISPSLRRCLQQPLPKCPSLHRRADCTMSRDLAVCKRSHPIRNLSKSEKRPNPAGIVRRSLADHFGPSSIFENADSPVELSKIIIKCISSIYRTSAANHPSSSPARSTSMAFTSLFSRRCKLDTSRCSVSFSQPDAQSVEVLSICLDHTSFQYASFMLKRFRSMIRVLEKVDPRKMKREEKLAFWINIHNSLILHAYLAYGTEISERSLVCSKAAYNIGGHCVTSNIIQQSILGIRSHTSERKLQTLFSSPKKQRHIYALDYPEPLVYFALSSGSHSDPTVRLYTAEGIFEELKAARKEFIQSGVTLKGAKIFVPKTVDLYAKDMSLDMAGVVEMIGRCVMEPQREAMLKLVRGKPEKCVLWVQEMAYFRFVFSGELLM